MSGGGGGGAGGGLITDANSRLLVEDDVASADIAVSDVTDQPLIDWSDDVPAPTIVEGDAITITALYRALDWGTAPGVFSGSIVSPPITYVSDGDSYGPILAATSPTYWAFSWAGYHNQPWSVAPCGVGPGAFSSWKEREIWIDLFVVPSHPADMAGIYLDIQMGGISGYAPGASVRVLGEAPAAGRQGVVVATIPASATTTVFIPATYVPDAGGHLWVGLGPSWQADYSSFIGTYQCGTSFQNPLFSGQYGSGRIAFTAASDARWAVYSDPGGDLGTTVELDEEEDPFGGGNTLIDMGIEGSPTTEVSGGAFRVTGPGGRCIGIVGDREDEEEPAGVWGDPYALSFEFEVDATGTGTGPHEIEVTTTRPGLQTIGTVHLGDDAHAPGISVAVGATTDYAAVTITTGDRWAARFDDRSGYFRGKLWRVADGEPTGWAVEIELPADGTEDILDRLVICVRADTGQTVVLYPIEAAANGSGSWVRERLGVADGLTDQFYPSHPFRVGTLSFDMAGVFAPPSSADGVSARTDYQPTAGMTVWAFYLAE